MHKFGSLWDAKSASLLLGDEETIIICTRYSRRIERNANATPRTLLGGSVHGELKFNERLLGARASSQGRDHNVCTTKFRHN